MIYTGATRKTSKGAVNVKKGLCLCAAALGLTACAGNYLTQTDKQLWEKDPMTVCSQLAASNRQDLDALRARYGTKAAEAAQPLFDDLNAQSFAVCRSRIAREAQNERLLALRAEYNLKIKQTVTETN